MEVKTKLELRSPMETSSVWIWRSRVENFCKKAKKFTLYFSFITAAILMVGIMISDKHGADKTFNVIVGPIAYFAIILILSFAIIGLVKRIERLAEYLFRNRADIARGANNAIKNTVTVGKDSVEGAASWVKSGFDSEELAGLSVNAGAIKEYSKVMGQFKDITLGWVIENHGPLTELPEHIMLSLTAYLVEASSSACRYADVDDSLKNPTNLALLKQMGFPESVAQGVLLALSNPLPLGNDLMFNLGGKAFNTWVRDGDAAAISCVQEAMTKWHNNNEIVGQM